MTPNRIAFAVALLLLAGTGLVVVGGVPEPAVAPPTAIPTEPPAPDTPWQRATLTPANGMEVAVLAPGRGTAARVGQVVVVSWTAWLEDRQLQVDQANHEFLVLGERGMVDGLTALVQTMQPGEVRQARIPPDLAYGQTGKSPSIPRNATLLYEIELHSVSDVRTVPDPPDPSLADQNDDGLRFATLQAGTGTPATPNTTIGLHLTCWLPDQSVVMSTLPTHRPARVVVGAGDLMPGIERAAAALRMGERRLLVLPPELGAGAAGGGGIPPNSPLTCEVERVPLGG